MSIPHRTDAGVYWGTDRDGGPLYKRVMKAKNVDPKAGELCTSWEGRQWLFDTHLRRGDLHEHRVRALALVGNEDAPERYYLFFTEDPKLDDWCWVLTASPR